ncbi:MAG: hypothetical protein Q8L68_05885, partial [Methylococcales bacterium]|nr:hypothetical protein [Methylococcales bacterium]
INILYFVLGSGTDYIYKGTTRFVGLHDHDLLELNEKQKQLFKKDSIESLYPRKIGDRPRLICVKLHF